MLQLEIEAGTILPSINRVASMKWILAALAISSCAHASALGLGDMRQLLGRTVVAAGEIETIDCPIHGKYDCSTWPIGLMKMVAEDVCFTAERANCSYSCNGFLAMGKDKSLLFFQVESFGRDLKSSTVQLMRCPDLY